MTLSERLAQITLIVVVIAVCYFVFAYAQGSVKFGKTLVNTGSPLEEGLVGHWTFDGPYVDLGAVTAEIIDSSDSQNDGNWLNHNNTTQTGKIGQALEFDGANDYVSIGNPSEYQLTGSATWSAWVKGDSFSDIKHIISKQGNTPDYGWRLGTSGANDTFVMGVTQAGVSMVDRESTIVPDIDTWYHVAGVYDADLQTLDIYIDGELDNGTLTGTVPSSQFDSSVDVTIGRRSAAGREWDGLIDDVRIYNRALSPDEVKQLYSMGSNKIAKTVYEEDTGLLAHWTFDGGNMLTNVGDASGNGNNGNLFGQSSTNTTPGKIGQALQFDGVDDYVEISGLLGEPTSFTLAAWVNVTSVDGAAAEIISIGDSVVLRADRVPDDRGVEAFYHDGSSYHVFSSGVDIEDTGWRFVVFTNDDTANEQFIYLDGAVIDSDSDTQSPAYVIQSNTRLGKHGGSLLTYDFGGLMDDVRVYNRALSPAEVKRLYNMGANKIAETVNPLNLEDGLFAHITFDGEYIDTSSTTAEVLDRSSNGYNGNWLNSTNPLSPGLFGQAAEFDGINDRVQVEHGPITLDTEFSMSAWVKYNSNTPSVAYVFSANDSNDGWGVTRASNDFAFRTYNVESGPANDIYAGITISLDTWYHVAVTFDNGQKRLYINGVEENSSTVASTIDVNRTFFQLGCNVATDIYCLPGMLDEVRVYDRALSEAEVVQLYNLGPY